MARQAHHHFIPSSYLKGFTEKGKDTSKFWGIPTNNDEAFLTNPKDACSKRDYYSIDSDDSLVIEKWYATEIEPKINIALKYINENKNLPSNDKMQYLFLLIATLYLRTPSYRETIEAPLKRTKEIVDDISSNINISNATEFNYTKIDIIRSEIKLIKTVIECLSNKYYRLHIIENSCFDVITSDNPFVLSHPNGGKNFYFGLNTSNIEICVPINKKCILIAQNEPFNEGVYSTDDKFIGLINTKLILNSDRFFYSSKSEIALVDDDINVHKHSISSNK